jgi:hypothetical protein
VKFTRDTQRGAWLLDRVGGWGRVGGVAGTGFEAYARILHPIHAWRYGDAVDEWGVPRIEEEAQWGWEQVAERNGRVMHPLVQWRRLTDDETALSFADGWEVSQTEEGRLEPGLLAALTTHLSDATSTPDDVTAGVWNGWGELHDGASRSGVGLPRGARRCAPWPVARVAGPRIFALRDEPRRVQRPGMDTRGWSRRDERRRRGRAAAALARRPRVGGRERD